MQRSVFLLSLAVFVLTAWSAEAVKPKKSCAQLLAEAGVEDVFSTQESFRRALEKVLSARLTKNSLPPLNQAISETKGPGDTAFLAGAQKLRLEIEIAHVEMEDAGDDTEDVFALQDQGKDYYFRPIHGGFSTATQPRKTMATSALNQAMNLSTVPRSRWAKVNNELGSLSDAAPGIPFNQIRQFRDVLSQLAEHYPEILSDLMAFEFLIGNKDAVRRNTMIDNQNVIVKVFDHDNAFLAGLVPIKGENSEDQSEVLFGVNLPETYTANFVERLKALTPPKLKALLSPFLSEAEIEGVMFRREIILEDIKLRKPKLLPVAVN